MLILEGAPRAAVHAAIEKFMARYDNQVSGMVITLPSGPEPIFFYDRHDLQRMGQGRDTNYTVSVDMMIADQSFFVTFAGERVAFGASIYDRNGNSIGRSHAIDAHPFFDWAFAEAIADKESVTVLEGEEIDSDHVHFLGAWIDFRHMGVWRQCLASESVE